MYEIPFEYKLANANKGRFKKKATFMYKGRQHTVYFGHRDYSDYTQHKDPERRNRYLARATKIRDAKGKLTMNNPLSPNYWAIRILWA